MHERETRGDRYENYALFASLALRLFDTLRADSARPGSRDRDGGALEPLRDLLNGSRNRAIRVSNASEELVPARAQGPEDELADYDLLLRLNHSLHSPTEVRGWVDTAVDVLVRLEQSGWSHLGGTEAQFVEDELEPFLEELAQLDPDYGTEELDEPEPLRS